MWIFGRSKLKSPAFDNKGPVPAHIAIIMDGNGRWASKRGLPRNVGHREGANTLKRVVRFCDDLGIRYLTVYAFSTENWSRPKDEVEALMSLLLEFLKNADKELAGKNIRIKVIGESEGLTDEIKNEIVTITDKTRNNKGLTLVIALNYGSRAEIAVAVKKIAREVRKGALNPESIDEKLISRYLYTADVPDPDFVIRPSGEQRISNFLLWQSSYSEFWYCDVLWPDFTKECLLEAITEYQKRNRRFGGL